jgi:hypothetical protein
VCFGRWQWELGPRGSTRAAACSRCVGDGRAGPAGVELLWRPRRPPSEHELPLTVAAIIPPYDYMYVLSVRLSTPGRHPKTSGFDVAANSTSASTKFSRPEFAQDHESRRCVQVAHTHRFLFHHADSTNIKITNFFLKKKKKYARFQFRIPCMPPARPHVVLWISIIMVGLASATGTAVWRGVVVCEVGHLWAILNTFTAGNYAPASSLRDRAVSRLFLFQCPYDTAFMFSP